GNKIYKNRLLKKGLECAAGNGSLFVAGTSLTMSTLVRPVSILATPKTDKDNKEYACAKSIASSAVGFGLMLGVTLPVAAGAEKIDKTPEQYLKPKTIKKLKETGKPLIDSKAYKLALQFFKLGIGAITAAPKAILTCLLIPPIMDVILKDKKSQKKTEPALNKTTAKTPGSNLSFTGSTGLNPIAKEMGKVIDKPFVQGFADRFKDSNFGMHAIAMTDTITTLTFAYKTKTSKKIEENRKNPLIYNALISTGLCIGGSYGIDKALNKPAEKFIKNFSEANKGSPKLSKYIEGIKIAKPALIMGGLYYAVIPVISTFLADRVDNSRCNKKT
ncbi:MAG: hypothetical protein LUB59_04430, partial [Candidatus Gastranaerophilales bacterium]|nr:hypothetical protein [Candidatus Gastranaerophilales bacterium]